MKAERGSVSVVTAAAMVVVLVCTLGIVDVGRVLSARSRGRTAADAAALAAAQELALAGQVPPTEVATSFAERNGATLVLCRCDPGTTEAVVTVRAVVGGLWLVPGSIVLDVSARAVVDLP